MALSAAGRDFAEASVDRGWCSGGIVE